MKKISIITISYNEEKSIEKTILSCIGQTYANKEYIIIDGGSKDGTLGIVENYKENIDVLVSEPDKGLYDAMNKGIRSAKGDYIIFVNSGDCLYDRNILSSIFLEVENSNTEPDFIYGDAIVKQFESDKLHYKKARHHKFAWYGMFTNHQAMIYSLDIIKRNNLLFDQTNYPISADYKFTLEFLTRTNNIKYIEDWLCIFDLNGVSTINKNQGLKEANNIRKEVLKYSDAKIWFIEKLIKSSHFLSKNFKTVYELIRFQS